MRGWFIYFYNLVAFIFLCYDSLRVILSFNPGLHLHVLLFVFTISLLSNLQLCHQSFLYEFTKTSWRNYTQIWNTKGNGLITAFYNHSLTTSSSFLTVPKIGGDSSEGQGQREKGEPVIRSSQAITFCFAACSADQPMRGRRSFALCKSLIPLLRMQARLNPTESESSEDEW